jgi:multiple sugar transport system permease protein
MMALGRNRLGPLLFFLLPGLGWLVVVRLFPALFTIYMSFTHWNLKDGTPPLPSGPGNYAALLHDSAFLASLARTLIFMVTATSIELVLGLAIALMLNRNFPLRRTVRTIVLAPMVITPAVVGMIWYIMFQSSIGPLNWFLSLVGLGPVGWLTDPHMALVSIIIADIWHWTPFMFLLCLAGLQTVQIDLTEAASVDGATPWQTLWLIILPAIRDVIGVAIVLRAMEAFEIFAEPYVMTSGGPGDATETLSLHIYKSAFLFFDMGYAGAMIVVSIGILVVLYGTYLRLAPQET